MSIKTLVQVFYLLLVEKFEIEYRDGSTFKETWEISAN